MGSATLRYRRHPTSHGQHRSPSSSSAARRHDHGHQNDDHSSCGQPQVNSRRRACNMYIWDAPSAILYKWCHYILKDHIYEGKGGYLFVRFESNSILQLLYPCSRYSPNRCALCGGSFPDHLQLWWSKRHLLYSPFDQYLDKTYKDALTVVEEENQQEDERGNRRRSKHSKGRHHRDGKRKGFPAAPASQAVVAAGPPTFAFHKRYVQDVSHLVGDIQKDPQKVKELIRCAVLEQRKNTDGTTYTNTKQDASKPQQWKKWFLERPLPFNTNRKQQSSTQSQQGETKSGPHLHGSYRLKQIDEANVSYLVPIVTKTHGKQQARKWNDTLLDVLGNLALWTVDDLIYVQHLENQHRAKFTRPQGSVGL